MPIIYECTHIGFYDIMILFEVIKRPCWLFWGNPNEYLTTLFGWMARKNGAILVDAYDKEDRHYAKIEAEMLLHQGGNLMIFPEGAWNITTNEPVMKLFSGAVSMAMKTNAEIVPIAIERYGKEFFVNIGCNMNIPCECSDTGEVTQKLRDVLATLKWKIWESQPMLNRRYLPDNMEELFINEILDEADGKYTRQMIESERYHDKNIVSKEEAFSFMDKLQIRKENVFLF